MWSPTLSLTRREPLRSYVVTCAFVTWVGGLTVMRKLRLGRSWSQAAGTRGSPS